ncbi:GNAT family N-acetyltransferase [Hathewaya massiliensis]|uniref:GNAT family N-acetyltransferase n=1 Tax=Hathewaya massiliensis TaxID=1964382 RepID=UPI00115A315C
MDAEVYKFNEISFKLLQSIGFKHEGTRREAYYENKNFADVLVLGLLKEDFLE